jgi:hypothetical protein
MVINDLRLMTGKRGPWVAMPAQKQLDRNGQPRADVNGKPICSQLIDSAIARLPIGLARWSSVLLVSVHPDALSCRRKASPIAPSDGGAQ